MQTATQNLEAGLKADSLAKLATASDGRLFQLEDGDDDAFLASMARPARARLSTWWATLAGWWWRTRGNEAAAAAAEADAQRVCPSVDFVTARADALLATER